MLGALETETIGNSRAPLHHAKPLAPSSSHSRDSLTTTVIQSPYLTASVWLAGRRLLTGLGLESTWPPAMLFDDLIDLTHDANRLAEADDDLLVVGDVVFRERAGSVNLRADLAQ